MGKMPPKGADRPGRVKVWKPKVRTGCKTCRARHLKCDETRPACSRCLKMGFRCDGYPKPKETPNDPRGLAPRNLIGLAPKSTPPHELSLSNCQFESQQEYLSFQIFSERTMFDLVGAGDSDLWNRIVLQACESEGAIRNAVMAIGALNNTIMAAKTDGLRLLDAANSDQYVNARHQFALHKYGNAIRQMRRDMEKDKYDLRTTMISCIMVVCFELFEGNHSTARVHASSGLKLIAERASVSKRGWPGSSEDNVDESLVDILFRLDQLSSPFALKSIMEIQDESKVGEDSPPTVFTSCKEARQAWKATVAKISQHMNFPENQGWSNPRSSGKSQTPISTTGSQELENETWEVDLAFTRTSVDHHYPQYELDQLLQWYTSFQPLYAHSRTANDAQLRCQAVFLKIRHHRTLIALISAQWDDELQYDNFTPLFREILDLSQELLEERTSPGKHRPIFTFNIGTRGCLWVVATKCRHSEMRWEAVNLLLEYSKREGIKGIWDSLVVAKGAEAIIKFEERGVVGTMIPEEARAKAEGVSFDLASRRAKLTYSRLARAEEFGLGKRIMDSVEVFW